MPRKPRKKRNYIAITYQQILCLIEHRNRIPGQHFRDGEGRREAWENNKAAIMALQGQPLDIGEDSSALQRCLKRKIWFAFFERPRAFYEFDRGEVFAGCTKKTTLGFKDYNTLDFGLSAYCSPEEREVYDLFGCSYPKAENAIIFETQKKYLIKKGLLNSREKAILKAEKAKNE